MQKGFCTVHRRWQQVKILYIYQHCYFISPFAPPIKQNVFRYIFSCATCSAPFFEVLQRGVISAFLLVKTIYKSRRQLDYAVS